VATDVSPAQSPPRSRPQRRLRRLVGALRRAPRRLWRGARLAVRAAPGYARALPAGRPWFVLRARLLPTDIRDRLARRTLAQRIMDHHSSPAPHSAAGSVTPTNSNTTLTPGADGQSPATPLQPPKQRTRYVLIVRHGQTHFNVEGRLPGQLPGVGLTDEGRRQAHQAAVALSALPLSAIVTSPLERARDTAEIIARGWALPLRLDPRLMDTDVGAWSGQKIEDVAKNDPNWKAFTEHPTDPPPGVESLAAVQTRAVAAVEAALGDPATGDYLVVVAHADVVKLIIAQYTSVSIDGVRFMSIANASISALAFPEVIHAPEPAPTATPDATTETALDAAPASAQMQSEPLAAMVEVSMATDAGVVGASPQTVGDPPQARPQRLTPTLLAVNWTQTPRWLVGPAPAASVSVAGVPTPTTNPTTTANPSGDTEGYMAPQDAPGTTVAPAATAASANGAATATPADQTPAPTAGDA